MRSGVGGEEWDGVRVEVRGEGWGGNRSEG